MLKLIWWQVEIGSLVDVDVMGKDEVINYYSKTVVMMERIHMVEYTMQVDEWNAK